MTTIETHTIGSEGITVSRLVWRRFRRLMPGMTERVLDINYGLAERGAVIPLGTLVKIPVDPPAAVPTRAVVNVWD